MAYAPSTQAIEPYDMTDEQLDAYRTDGYAVLPNFFSPSDAARLLARARELLEEMSLDGHPMTRFTTSREGDAEQKKHVGDDYFLNSGDKIRYFFDEGAFGPDGQLNRPKEQSVNKVGHALHSLDPVFSDFTFSESVRAVERKLDVHRNPVVPQSMAIYKQPRIGGEVPIHDDSTFLYTDPVSAVGYWFALEDCTLSPADNGCLSFVPGSHKRNKVPKRFVRAEEGGTTFKPVLGVDDEEIDWSKEPWRTEEVKAGSLVLIDGRVIHKSEHNRSERSRIIYTFHCIEGDLPYPADNWLQPTASMPFTPLFPALAASQSVSAA